MLTKLFSVGVVGLFLVAPSTARSAEPETVDVSKVTEKYWAQGKDSEIGVVQNRKYSNAQHFELGLYTGTISTDPFLSVHQYGVSLGYYLTEYSSIHALAWRTSVSDSEAYQSFKSQAPNVVLNTNRPRGFYGTEMNQNILYGKASLFGMAIIYVDIFALGGVGVIDTSTGSNFTYFMGIGQKIHITQKVVLNLDYRIMQFNEKIPTLDGRLNDRSNTSDAITLGIGLFI